MNEEKLRNGFVTDRKTVNPWRFYSTASQQSADQVLSKHTQRTEFCEGKLKVFRKFHLRLLFLLKNVFKVHFITTYFLFLIQKLIYLIYSTYSIHFTLFFICIRLLQPVFALRAVKHSRLHCKRMQDIAYFYKR